MKKTIQKLQGNKNITKLLQDFEKDFLRVYEGLNLEEKSAMLGVRDTIFRKWLYSPIIDETYVTPAYLINTMVVMGGEENGMILPHIKAMPLKDGTLEFERTWITYSKDSHPVIEDLNKLMAHCDPTLIVRDGNHYIVDKGEALIEDINFRSNYYLKYLMDTAIEIGILEELKAIGCKCYRPSKGYEEFKAKENLENLKLITEVSVHRANNQFQQQLNHQEEAIVEGFLKEFVTIDDFGSYIEQLEAIHRQSFNEFLGTLNKKDKAKLLGEVQNISSEAVPTIVATAEFGVLMDSCFSSVFGYYLGILIPTYPNMFSIDIFTKTFINSPDEQFTMNALFEVESCHHLTQFGGDILGTYKKEILIDNFNQLKLEYVGEEVDRYIASKEKFLGTSLDMDGFDFLSGDFQGDDEKDEFESVYEVLDEHFGPGEIEVPKVIFKHIVEFADYLDIEKNLKIETCEKHCQNIETFIWHFLKAENLKALKEIDEEVVHSYIGDWYIKEAATSKTNVKEQISSLTHYSRYLEKKKIIGSEMGKKIRDLLKVNKENYLELFDEYMGEDYYS